LLAIFADTVYVAGRRETVSRNTVDAGTEEALIMIWHYRARHGSWLAVLAGVALVPAALWASDRPRGVSGFDRFNPENETIELFAGIEQGQIEARLIPRDSTRCRLLITNKTDKPLNVKFPQALAGVPVLAQGGLDQGLNLDQNRGNQHQVIGGGFPTFNQRQGRGPMQPPLMNLPGRMGPQRPQGVFSIPPERVGRVRLTTVCLEYGKREPSARIKYEIRPIEAVTDKAAVWGLCRMVGRDGISQRAAQAAAWHLASEMSWEALATLRHHHANGTSDRRFTPQEVRAGRQLADAAVEQAKRRPGQPRLERKLSSLR